MARTRSAAKRQRVATAVESALANIDVVSQLAAFLEAKDLCQVKATCKALGSANGEAASNGLSMAEEAAKRVYEGALDEEKAALPRHESESWIVLYHHLLMLRSRLTFDQLVGLYVEYQGGDRAAVQGVEVNKESDFSTAICGKHIMRAGKHWTTFTSSAGFHPQQTVGVIRPLPGWETRGLDWFTPGSAHYYDGLRNERTVMWEGDVHYCRLNPRTWHSYWSDWMRERVINANWEGNDNYDGHCNTLAMMLDLGEGTLSLYQNGRRWVLPKTDCRANTAGLLDFLAQAMCRSKEAAMT